MGAWPLSAADVLAVHRLGQHEGARHTPGRLAQDEHGGQQSYPLVASRHFTEAAGLGPRNDVPHSAIKAECCRFRNCTVLRKVG